MAEGLEDVVVEGAGGVAEDLALPVRERVREEDVRVAGGDDSVGCAVRVLVPRVRRADLEGAVCGRLHVLDLGE